MKTIEFWTKLRENIYDVIYPRKGKDEFRLLKGANDSKFLS